MDSYYLLDKKEEIENYDIENSKGCSTCPFRVDMSSFSGGYTGCIKYGEISSYSNRGGGVDYDIDRGDGTRRLPQCEVTLGEMKRFFKEYALGIVQRDIDKYTKKIKDLNKIKDLL